MNNKKWSLDHLLSDNNLIRDLKSIFAFLLAYLVAVISNGLIEEFTPGLLISLSVALGTFGTFFALKIITNEFTERGAVDEEENNEELKTLLEQQIKLSNSIENLSAYDILNEYNKEKFKMKKQEKLDEIKNKLEITVKKYEILIDNAKLQDLRWFRFINKRYLRILKKKHKKMNTKLKKLSLNDVRLYFEPIKLEYLKSTNFQKEDEKSTEARRFKLTPQNKVRRQMSKTNFVKTFFFVGFQGAVLAQISSWSEFLIFLLLMTLALVSTALFAYVTVRRYSAKNYTIILREKIEKLNWLISEQNKLKNPS